MKTLDRAVNAAYEFYTNGNINDAGFSTLSDMFRILDKLHWDKKEAIEYVMHDYSKNKEQATDLIEWALQKLTA